MCVALYVFCVYTSAMKGRPGRPRSRTPKQEHLILRLTEQEKLAFNQCADMSGLPMSAWVRERLRRASVRELEEAGLPIPFLKFGA
jgi:hypothetical protein